MGNGMNRALELAGTICPQEPSKGLAEQEVAVGWTGTGTGSQK